LDGQQPNLVVAHEVTNVGSDRTELSRMTEQARAAMGSEAIEVVADRGYHSGEKLVVCEQAGATVYLPKPMAWGVQATRSGPARVYHLGGLSSLENQPLADSSGSTLTR
jgi:hypothetical protein